MTSTAAYASYLETYGIKTPYLDVQEYLNAPTAIDVNNLLAGATQEAQETALKEVIYRASSWIDGYVTGSAYNTLNATSNVETARVWGSRDGTLRLHPKLWPILEIQSIAYTPVGLAFSTAASIVPAGNCWIEPTEVIITPGGTSAFFNGTGVNGIGLGAPYGVTTCEYYIQFQYVSGFANTQLAASVAAGAASISVTNAIGIYPNTLMEMFNAPNDEPVQVASTYVPTTATIPTTTTIPLAAPLVYNHDASAVVTNIPKSVKQAAILLTNALIKQRGSGALIVSDMGAATRVDTGSPQNLGGDIGLAMKLLDTMRQRYIGY